VITGTCFYLQEVTDAEGRRRFHGAFTGGYSAGYYNTVGSAEGWAPAAFRSSRAQRAGAPAQSVEQFLDDDELEEAQRAELRPVAAYDTFGGRAAGAARTAAAADALARPPALPSLLPDDVLAPVADGAGVRLLQRMGWRQGKGVGAARERDQDEQPASGRGWGRQAGVGAENAPLHLLRPKTDVHGLGYDPFKVGASGVRGWLRCCAPRWPAFHFSPARLNVQGAEEFRAAKRQRSDRAPSLRTAPAPGRHGVAFGTGALDEDDSYGIMADYVMDGDVETYGRGPGAAGLGLPQGRAPRIERPGLGDRLALQGYSFEVQDPGDEGEGEGEEGGGGRPSRPAAITGGPAAPLLLHDSGHAGARGLIPGFVKAAAGLQRPAFFPPPVLPPGYAPSRRRAQPQAPAPALLSDVPHVHPPEDAALRQEIDQLAFFVARRGVIFEGVARGAQRKAGRAAFLLDPGAPGAAYYRYKLAALQALMGTRRQREPEAAIGQRPAPLSADERGALLGEAQLPSARAPAAPAATPPAQPPLQLARSLLNVAAADREKLQAALGSAFVRAQDAAAAPEGAPVVQGGLRPGYAAPPLPPSTVGEPHHRIITVADLSRAAALPPPGAAPPGLPLRRVDNWRPAPLLCKRLDVADPWQGREREAQAVASRTDRLALPSTAAAAVAAATAAAGGMHPSAPAGAQQAPPWQRREEPPPLPPAPLEPAQDAAGMADAFLSSLLGGGPATAGAPPAPWADEEAAAPPPPPPPERPLDLFEAIFQDSEDEPTEEEPEQRAGGDGDGDGDGACILERAAQPAGWQRPECVPPPRAGAVGFEKFREGGELRGATRPRPAGAPTAVVPAIDDEVKRRVEEALRALRKPAGGNKDRKHKKHKDKDRKQRKERRGR
jgi:G patch domain-containing protein 1